MLNSVEQRRRVEDEQWRVGDGQGRWDVGLGERLVQTIWRWLGRDERGPVVRLPELWDSGDGAGPRRKAA